MNRFFRRVYKHLDPKCKNRALTYSHYALKQVMGFCKPLQALVLAIVVFWGIHLCERRVESGERWLESGKLTTR